MNLEISEDTVYTFSVSRTVDNALKALTSAKITIKKSDGTVMVNAQSMTVSSNVGTYQVNFATDPTAGTWERKRNYLAQYTMTYTDTTTEVLTRLFDIVRYAFVNQVTDQNLVDENRLLADGLQEDGGTATGGTISTLIDTARTEANDYWNGGKLLILPTTDTGKVTEHIISDFASSTKTFTFAPSLTSAVTVENYTVRRSYQALITTSGEIVAEDLAAQSKQAYLCVDSTQLSRLIVYKALERYFQQLRGAENDKYDLQFKYYQTKYNELFSAIPLNYDADDSGSIDDDEVGANMSVLNLSR